VRHRHCSPDLIWLRYLQERKEGGKKEEYFPSSEAGEKIKRGKERNEAPSTLMTPRKKWGGGKKERVLTCFHFFTISSRKKERELFPTPSGKGGEEENSPILLGA